MDLRSAPARLGNTDLNVFVRKLQKIPVTGDNGYVNSLLLAPFCHSAQNIIGLKALQGQGGNIHGRQGLLYQGHLLS